MASLVIPEFPAIMAALTIIPPRDAAISGLWWVIFRSCRSAFSGPLSPMLTQTQPDACFAVFYGIFGIDAIGAVILAYGPCSTTLAVKWRN